MTREAKPSQDQATGRRRGRGRPGGFKLARDFLVLISSLDDEGDAVTIDTVATRLDIPSETARFLVENLLGLNVVEGAYLPLIDEGDRVSLMSSTGVKGRPLRLSHAETYAILTALDRLGVAETDPVRSAIQGSFANSDIDSVDVERLLSPVGTPVGAATLDTCVRAILSHHQLSFEYQGTRDAEPRQRVIEPIEVHQSNNAWCIDGIDISLGAERTFRIDRMRKAVDTGIAFSPDEARALEEPTARSISVVFRDASFLNILEWPGLRVVSETNGTVTADVAYRGGDWLPRHLMACGSSVEVVDEEVRGRMQDLALEALEEAVSSE